ncbi:MFS transporter [Virgibacillus xinjiangensis]|uniref:MFS transporter n=1 Tax=Virgibacillus xinjiangensis TaxID=393090 RepID=A0ABV7CSJ2_9BACI
MSHTTAQQNQNYHTARMWQIALFSLNNSATNLYNFAIGFVSYYATGIAGLTVAVVSIILTSMRVFDGVTDPIIGYIIDKTESKLGKFRPLIILGNVILAGSILIMYNVTHMLPESMQFLFFIAIYVVYIIGYTLQTAVTKAGQTVLTNHPKQRPLFSVFDGVFTMLVYGGGQFFVASNLVVKYNDEFSLALFTELNMYVVIISALLSVCSVIAIWNKDRKEFYGLAENTVKTSFREYLPVLKKNRPLQMLIIAASTDKLASSSTRQPAVAVMFFGILIGDYALSGTISLVTMVPVLIISVLGSIYARKVGLKRSFVRGSWGALLAGAIIMIMMLMIDPTTISMDNMGVNTWMFLILITAFLGLGGLTNALVIPMIADVSDYETYKSGRYIPGMLGTIFSFVDKLISSLAPAIVGFMLAMIGYQEEFPQIGESLTTALFIMSLVLYLGIPILGYIASLLAMKFYTLDDKRMREVQEGIAEMKKIDMDQQEQVQ